MVALYPIELNLTGREALVVGGGPVAARKATGLVQAGAAVRVVSLEFVPELRRLEGVRLEQAAYTPEAIGAACLVFACTDDRQTNARIAADARRAGRWCNVADDQDLSDFCVPATLRRGLLTIAVGTGGAAPHLAASVRSGLESQFGPEWSMLLAELQRARVLVRERIRGADLRRHVLATLGGEQSVELLKSKGADAWREWLERLLHETTGGDPAATGTSGGAGS